MKYVRWAGLAVLALAGLLVSGLCAPSPLTWGAAGPPLVLEPVPVQQGGRLRLAGHGFFPGEAIEVRATVAETSPQTVDLPEVRASLRGVLAATHLVLPMELTSGAHQLEAVGQISRRRSTATLYVRANAPWINLGSSEVKPFDKLGLVAGGFDSRERVLISLEPKPEEVKRDAPAVSTGSADTPVGTPVKPVDPAPPPSGRTGVPAAEPSAAPARAVDTATPLSGAAGVSPAESGAAPAKPVDLATLPTDPAGNTTWTGVQVPRVDYGAYMLVARGESSGQELRKDVTIKPLQPIIELSPWAGPPGTNVQANAKGFAPGERVRVYFGKDPREAATLSADEYGNFWGAGPARVPYQVLSGTLAMTFIGQDSGAFAMVEFKVLEPNPWLELTGWWGPPGMPVGFTGGGWAAGERVRFHIGSARTPAAAEGEADDYGWLRSGGPVYIPREAVGSVTFVAVGQESGAIATASFNVVYPFGLTPPGATPDSSPPASPTEQTGETPAPLGTPSRAPGSGEGDQRTPSPRGRGSG